MTDWVGPLIALLSHSPGLSAREIASRLRGQGYAVDKHQINRFIYYDARFENDHGRIPCWRLTGASTSSGFTRDARGAERQARRSELDRRQATIETVRSRTGTTAGGVDDDVRQAIALLRSRGIPVDDLELALSSSRSAAPRRADTAPNPQRARARVQDEDQPRSHPRLPRLTPRPSLPAPTWSLRLRPWQEEALARWYDAGGIGVCEAVTGTGKTHLGLEAVAQCVRRAERATVLVPSVLLQRQWQQQFQRFVPEATIAKVGGETQGDPHRADVVIAVVNSATKRDLTEFGSNMTLLVADEVHRYGGEAWSAALRSGYDYRLGLTATLERGSDEGVAEVLLPYFGSIAHHYGYDRATRERVVAPFDLVFLGVDLEDHEQVEYDTLSRKISHARKILIGAGGNPQKLNQQLAALRSMGGDVTRAVMAYESATRERRRLLADTHAKHGALAHLAEVVGESRGTVIFTQSKETADAAAALLIGSDPPLRAAAIYSEGMSPGQRQSLIDALGDEELDALAAPRILDEGVDIPDIDLGIVMGASSSRRQMIQRLGRVIRLKSDNRRARFVILYVIGSVEDPATGNRDDFMDEVEDAASKVLLFDEWDSDTIDDIWSGAADPWQRDETRLHVTPTSQVEAAPALRDEPRITGPLTAQRTSPMPPVAAWPHASTPETPAPATPTKSPPQTPAVGIHVPPAPTVRDILAAQSAREASARRATPTAARTPDPETAIQPIAYAPEPPKPPSRLSRPLATPRRPEYPDPVMLADLLSRIDESVALTEWVRSELTAQKGA